MTKHDPHCAISQQSSTTEFRLYGPRCTCLKEPRDLIAFYDAHGFDWRLAMRFVLYLQAKT